MISGVADHVAKPRPCQKLLHALGAPLPRCPGRNEILWITQHTGSDSAPVTVAVWDSLSKLGVAQLSVLSEDTLGRTFHPVRRRVSIRRDGRDFVVAFQPEDIIVFRYNEASALRRACHFLRWEIVSDTVADPLDPASW